MAKRLEPRTNWNCSLMPGIYNMTAITQLSGVSEPTQNPVEMIVCIDTHPGLILLSLINFTFRERERERGSPVNIRHIDMPSSECIQGRSVRNISTKCSNIINLWEVLVNQAPPWKDDEISPLGTKVLINETCKAASVLGCQAPNKTTTFNLYHWGIITVCTH